MHVEACGHLSSVGLGPPLTLQLLFKVSHSLPDSLNYLHRSNSFMNTVLSPWRNFSLYNQLCKPIYLLR